MVLIGLDYGSKRVGIAKTDELNMFAHAIGFIDIGKSNDFFLVEFNKYLSEYMVKKIIVGMPINLSGEKGQAALGVDAFVKFLKAKVEIPIVTWDERLTTKEASRYMQDSSLSGTKKRKRIDGLAAQIMLQNYIDTNRDSL